MSNKALIYRTAGTVTAVVGIAFAIAGYVGRS
jgi:hypothetical protein